MLTDETKTMELAAPVENAPTLAAERADTTGDAVRNDFMSRLLVANLRTEAVRAGMIDLDGLKLIDLSALRLDEDDTVVGGHALMAELRRNKPWLFGALSSSSASSVPASQPVRQKTALEMSDEEYAAARKTITRYSL